MNPSNPVAKTSPVLRSRGMLSVLVVDDDAFQHDLITELLRALQITNVQCVSSGEQAMQKLAAKAAVYDVVLLDLHMPGMDGFQFMEALARSGYGGSLIIVSGQSDDVMHAATLVAKLRRFTLLGSVAKPVERAALSRLIRPVVS